MTTLIAHGGHWLLNVAYLLPVVGFMAWLGVTQWKERRKRTERQQSPGCERSDPPS